MLLTRASSLDAGEGDSGNVKGFRITGLAMVADGGGAQKGLLGVGG